MSTVVGLRFPTGRYHATPWNRGVNEGAVEWPPSPWRLLRALYATWQNRLPELGQELVASALAGLAQAPSYWLPRHSEAHTRHYYPDSAYGTDKVFDPFAAVDSQAELLVRWQRDLDVEQSSVVDQLCRRLPYLGRADSLCEARLLTSDEALALPSAGWSDPGGLGDLSSAPVRVLAPVEPLDLKGLLATTTEVRRGGHTSPPGTRWVTYLAQPPSVPPAVARKARRPRPTAEAVLLRLDGPVRPSVHEAVAYGDVLHRAASRHGEGSATLTGRDGDDARRDGHAHAHYFVLDADGDLLLDSAVVWAPEGLADSDVEALGRIRRLSTREPGFRPVRVAVNSVGSIDALLPEFTGLHRTWRSDTPFAPYRHPGKRQPLEDFLLAELARELATRGLPQPDAVRLVAKDWLAYRRRRLRSHREECAYGLEVHFAAPLAGPLSLGALSHFGLGLFRPVP